MLAADDLGYLANRFARLLRGALASEVAATGLTAQQAAVLLAVGETGGVAMAETADRLGMDRATLTGVADRLAKAGFVETRVNPSDRRSRLLALSDRGRALLPELRAAGSRVSRSCVAGLTDDDAATLLALLRKAVTTLETAEGCRA